MRSGTRRASPRSARKAPPQPAQEVDNRPAQHRHHRKRNKRADPDRVFHIHPHQHGNGQRDQTIGPTPMVVPAGQHAQNAGQQPPARGRNQGRCHPATPFQPSLYRNTRPARRSQARQAHPLRLLSRHKYPRRRPRVAPRAAQATSNAPKALRRIGIPYIYFPNRAGRLCAHWLIVPAPRQTTISPGFAVSRTSASSSSSVLIARALRWP